MLRVTLFAAGLMVLALSFETSAGGQSFTIQAGEHGLPVSPVLIAADLGEGEPVHVLNEGNEKLPASVIDRKLVVIGGELKAGESQSWTVTPRDTLEPENVAIQRKETEDALTIAIDDAHFTTYYYGGDEKFRKPHMWPVNGAGGVSVTRVYPMGEADQSKDHPHQQSLWTAYGDINGADWWEYGQRTGWQRTEDVEWGSGSALGWIRSRIIWEDKDHKPVLAEAREYLIYNMPETARIMDVNIVLTAEFGDVEFKDTKEGGMVSVRIADVIRERGGTGTITNSAGGVGAGQTWGKPAAWCDYSGEFPDGTIRGLTIMNHPDSFRFPTHWHVRNYGLMGANAFGYSYFTNGERNGDHVLQRGDSMVFRYRVYVHSGDVEESKVAGVFAAYSDPPKVTWKD